MPLHTSGRPPSTLTAPAQLLADDLRELLQQHRSARLDQIEAFHIARTTPTADRAALLRAAASAEAVVHEIDDALVRVDDGTYGTCSCCPRPVEPERLAAAPWSARCAGCAGALVPLA